MKGLLDWEWALYSLDGGFRVLASVGAYCSEWQLRAHFTEFLRCS